MQYEPVMLTTESNHRHYCLLSSLFGSAVLLTVAAAVTAVVAVVVLWAVSVEPMAVAVEVLT